jgi:hypothetical protein
MDFTVLLQNTLVVDRLIWKLWLLGLTVDQAQSILAQKRPASLASLSLVTSQVSPTGELL